MSPIDDLTEAAALLAQLAARMRAGEPFTGPALTDAVPYLSRWVELEPENPQPLKLRLQVWGQLKDLGLAIPPSVLQQATEAIQ